MMSESAQRASLYRRAMEPEEQALYDALRASRDYDDLTAEIAMTRVVIHRCVMAVCNQTDWRVPLQVMPSLLGQLNRMIARMKPQAQRVILEDDTEQQLHTMIKATREEQQVRRLEKLEAELQAPTEG